jgi:hypothetical protein
MIGKRVQFDDETWAAINLLRQDRRRSFQHSQMRRSAIYRKHRSRLHSINSSARDKSVGVPAAVSKTTLGDKDAARCENLRRTARKSMAPYNSLVGWCRAGVWERIMNGTYSVLSIKAANVIG